MAHSVHSCVSAHIAVANAITDCNLDCMQKKVRVLTSGSLAAGERIIHTVNIGFSKQNDLSFKFFVQILRTTFGENSFET